MKGGKYKEPSPSNNAHTVTPISACIQRILPAIHTPTLATAGIHAIALATGVPTRLRPLNLVLNPPPSAAPAAPAAA